MPTIYNQLLEVIMPLKIIGNQWIKLFVTVVTRKLQGLRKLVFGHRFSEAKNIFVNFLALGERY